MKRSGLVGAAGACVAAAGVVALGDITYTVQTRSVLAKIVNAGQERSFAADDFGAFDVDVRVGDPGVQCEAKADQHSELLADRMSASGSVRGTDGIQSFSGWAESLFDVTFEVAEPVAYRLVGGWTNVSFYPIDDLRVRLTGSAGTIHESAYTMGDQSDEFDDVGLLPAGEYRLFARGWARSGPLAVVLEGEYDVELITSECLADITGDGIVDFSDYLEFLNLFEAGEQRVDFTLDGIVDFADYLEFLNLFDAGCDD